MIEIRQLRYAVMTADTMSFSRAASALNVKQSTLSKRILMLEQQLGVTLFERTTRGAIPTETGKVFLTVARRIVTDVDNLRTTARAVNYGEAGRISVGFSSSLTAGNLRMAISDFLTRYPDVQFDGVEKDTEALLSGLHTRIVDIAIVAADLTDPGIRSRPLWSERLMVALPEAHPLLENERIYFTDLRREVFVLPSGGAGPSIANLLAARITDQGHRPNIIAQDTSYESVLSIVSVGRFITVVSEASMGVAWPGVVFREVHEPNGQARIDVSAYWREDNDNPALKRFFKLIDERYPAAVAVAA
jgi:DNA-binding transcriptional LysR family regulator